MRNYILFFALVLCQTLQARSQLHVLSYCVTGEGTVDKFIIKDGDSKIKIPDDLLKRLEDLAALEKNKEPSSTDFDFEVYLEKLIEENVQAEYHGFYGSYAINIETVDGNQNDEKLLRDTNRYRGIYGEVISKIDSELVKPSTKKVLTITTHYYYPGFNYLFWILSTSNNNNPKSEDL